MTNAVPSADRFTAWIPMKGHSERVPDKNLRSLGGRPLYHHVMASLLESPFVDEIIINTDSDRIAADVERNFPGRARVSRRPERLWGDFINLNLIIESDFPICRNERLLQTHSTNPLLSVTTIDAAIRRWLSEPGHDSLFSVNRYQSRFYTSGGTPVNHNPEELLRTQDLPPVYEENSNLYLFSKESFRKRNRRIGLKPILFETPRSESVDIDTETDFKMAELLFRRTVERT